MKIIEYKKVTIQVGENNLLKDIDFELNANQFVFITGKIGSGKTSFLKTIYAQKPIKQGSAYVLGFNLNRITNKQIHLLRRRIGYVFQEYNFLKDRNIYENFAFVLEAMGWKERKQIYERIVEVSEKVQMSDKLEAMPYELSGGELQSLAVARSILNYPNLILADEPTGNLDEIAAQRVVKLLYSLISPECSVVFVTHNHQNFEYVSNYSHFRIENTNLTKIV